MFFRTAQDPESLCPTGSVNSGLHRQGTSSNSTVNICHLTLHNVMLRWHCSRVGNVVIICQPACKNCAPLLTSWQLSMRVCLRRVLESWFCPTTDTDVPEAASPVVTNPLNARTSPASAASLVDNHVPPSTVQFRHCFQSFLWYPTLSWICILMLNRLTRVRPASLKVGQSS